MEKYGYILELDFNDINIINFYLITCTSVQRFILVPSFNTFYSPTFCKKRNLLKNTIVFFHP